MASGNYLLPTPTRCGNLLRNPHGVGMRDAIQVFEQIREATQTIRKLPRVTVRTRFCNWPDFIRDSVLPSLVSEPSR